MNGKVVVDLTVSLDGFATAAGNDLEHGLGIDGQVLHEWLESDEGSADRRMLDETYARAGAVIMGRRTFDFIDGPHGWPAELGDPDSGAPPIVVVTSSIPERTRLGGRFRFATGGLVAALDQAREYAGERDVLIMGGGTVANGFLNAGLVDELVLHVAPVVLGGGTPLFPAGTTSRRELTLTRTVPTAAAVHLTYEVSR
jgi:dihydrofolate reductase